jgi:SAM-dependent methyltransferase
MPADTAAFSAMPVDTGSAVCPVCGAGDARVYLAGRDDTLDSAEFGSSRRRISCGTILRCRACGFAFRRARSTPEELAELYRRMDTRVYEAEAPARERTARTHFGIVRRYVTKGRLLDVGCASGLFLGIAAQAGWQVTGLEPAAELYPRAVQRLAGRGRVYPLTLEQARLEDSFDAIVLWDVLEHVASPRAFLATCASLLSPGGYLFLNVPDLDTLQARVLGSRWPLLLAEHLNYFNRPSLRLCAEEAGLRSVTFGRRSVWFSLEYAAWRMAQHRIPLAPLLYSLSRRCGSPLVPLRMGETYGVFRRP